MPAPLSAVFLSKVAFPWTSIRERNSATAPPVFSRNMLTPARLMGILKLKTDPPLVALLPANKLEMEFIYRVYSGNVVCYQNIIIYMYC